MPSRWFEIEDGLLAELKQARGAQRAPELAGYDGLVEVRRGGQGVVYSAVQRSTGRRVAVKVLREGWSGSARGQAAARARFEREVEAAASLKHPSIVSVYDSGLTADGRPFLVMEFIEGRPLDEAWAELRSDSPAGVRQTLGMMASVARAVEHAHLRGVIHRDLKPSNIRVDREGRAKVLDFGLAKLVGGPGAAPGHGLAPGAAEVSVSGQFVGSLAWASPEQLSGDPDAVDARTDVYSLGVMLYRALTGRMPHGPGEPGGTAGQPDRPDGAARSDLPGPSSGTGGAGSGGGGGGGGLRELVEAIASREPVKPTRVASWLGDEVETIVLRCLAKDPARRYGGAGELAADLERYLDGRPILAKGDSALYALRTSLKRHRAVAWGAVACVALSAVAAGWLWVLYGRAVSAERAAERERDGAASARASAEATAGFLRDVLASPDPSKRGRDVRVVDLLDAAAARLTRREGELPARSRATLAGTLGTTYLELGEWAKAEPLLTEALESRRRLLGGAHEETVSSLAALSYLRRTQGRLADGEALAREAVALAEANLAPGTVARVDSMHALGLALMERGAMDECLAVLERAMDESRRAGLMDGRAQTLFNSLALANRKHRRLDRAEEMYRSELARVEAAAGAGGPGAGAESGWESYASTLRVNLGSLLHERLKWDEAEGLYRAALSSRERLYGPDHPETLAVLLNLAKFLTDRKRFDEAGPLHERLVSRCESVLGPEHPTTLIVLSNYAFHLEESGRKAEAAEIARRALEVRRRVLGPEHPSTLISMNNLAGMLSGLGRREEGLAMHREVLTIRERKLGADHRDTLVSMNNTALALQAMDRDAEAEALFRRASDGAARALGRDNWVHGAFRGNLGRCLVKLGRGAEAEAELLESYRVLSGSQGPGDSRSRQTARSLASLYESQGRAEEAARWSGLGAAPSK